MDFFKILWRGVRDVYDSFMYFILVSLVFWLLCSPMIFGYGFLAITPLYIPIFFLTAILVPPAMLVLYALVDPRDVVNRMEWGEAFSLIRTEFIRSWKVAFISLVPLVMISWNILYFIGSGHMLELFVPLWIVMFVFLLVYTLYCYSLAGTHESGWRNSFRGGMYVMVKYPFRSIFLSLFTLVLGYVMTLSLLPMLIIGPAFFAAIVNRFVFDALEVEVIDPDQPTDERSYEKARGIDTDQSLVDRVLRRGKR